MMMDRREAPIVNNLHSNWETLGMVGAHINPYPTLSQAASYAARYEAQCFSCCNGSSDRFVNRLLSMLLAHTCLSLG